MHRLEVLSGWHVLDVRAMGSTARLLAHGVSEAALLDTAAELERLEDLWSRFRPSSDVVRMNEAAGQRPVPVSPDTIALVERAIGLWAMTGHRFDPTVLRALEANGYDDTFARVRERRMRLASAPIGRAPMTLTLDRWPESNDVEASPGCGGIEVDSAARTVYLPEGVSIDLGGVGKGYAADVLSANLVAQGATAACVSMGGDISCRGLGPDDGGWDIAVEDPRVEGRTLLTAHLDESAIVTSTTLLRRWTHRGRTRHHLIDPATGRPSATGLCAAIVADAHAWRAEGFAKAAVVAGLDEALDLLDRANLAGLVVDDNGLAHCTARAIEEAAS